MTLMTLMTILIIELRTLLKQLVLRDKIDELLYDYTPVRTRDFLMLNTCYYIITPTQSYFLFP